MDDRLDEPPLKTIAKSYRFSLEKAARFGKQDNAPAVLSQLSSAMAYAHALSLLETGEQQLHWVLITEGLLESVLTLVNEMIDAQETHGGN